MGSKDSSKEELLEKFISKCRRNEENREWP